MKIFRKILIFSVLLPVITLGVMAFAKAPSHTAYAAEDWCKENLGSWIECPTDEISFREYKGKLVTLNPDNYDTALTQTSSVREFVAKIVNYALSFLGLVAILLIIYAGVMYLVAGGNQENADKAKKTIGYTAIGLILILGSYAIVNTILTGPFSKDAKVEGELEGYASTGFNASTESIISSAENLMGGYKYLMESVSVFESLKADAEKESIKAGNNKSLLMQYLTNVKAKLQQVRYKAPRFSKINSSAGDTMRYIDDRIDYMQNLPELPTGEDIPVADDPLPDAWEEIKAILVDNTADASAPAPSLNDLLDIIKEDFAGIGDSNTTEFDAIITQVDVNDPESFKKIPCSTIDEDKPKGVMGDQFCVLSQVYSEIAGLEIFKTTGIPALFEGLLLAFQNLAGEVWQTPINTAVSNELFVSIIQTEDELIKVIKDIKFVKTKLIADVVEGSAPLIVHFDVLDSKDPSGETIAEDSIVWDLVGEGFGAPADPNNLDKKCYTIYNPIADTETETQGPGKGFNNYCVYRNPGTYRAAVRIESSNEEFATGVSSLDIKVLPPETKMTLTATIKDQDPITMIDYSPSGFLKQSVDYITVTESKAQQGITFDASGTEANFPDQEIINYKWDLGNGETEELVTEAEGLYHNEGVYTVMFEVMAIDGSTARKIFNVIVGSPAARVELIPKGPYKIGQTITFDASKSSTDTGTITNYKWVISKSVEGTPDGATPATAEEVAKGSEKLFYQTFEEPGDYDISLTVTDSLGNSATASIKSLKVESEPPVALFEYKIPEQSSPSEVHFDASKSYDPDGDFEELFFEWATDPKEEPGVVDYVNGSTPNDVKPTILFGEKGDYTLTLKVWNKDEDDKVSELKQTITIDNTLDVDWSKDQQVTSVLNEEGEAEMVFIAESKKGIAYEIDFGDGETETGQFKNGQATTTHTYQSADKFTVRITAYDDDDNYNEIKRKIFIGGGENPVAKISIYINGEKYIDFEEPLAISRADVVTFDASESKNTDGTARDLNYSWDFGDSKKSSKKSIVHSYNELSPKDPGHYEVKLKVYDKDDEDKFGESKLKVNVISVPPRFSSLQALPQTGEDMVTPVNMKLQLFGAVDPDGKITQFRWWYFDVSDPDEILGLQITETSSAALIIGTNGSEGDEKEYGFGVEMTDNDNEKISSEDDLEQGEIPTITVTNGANAAPQAKFNVDRTKVFAGEAVNFSSASTDPDGDIIEYIWDFEGDGFFNNIPTTLSTVSHTYDTKDLNGYKVKLKVIDDKHGEAVSDTIAIFVDSNAEEPTAAFKGGSIGGKTVEFINNSTVDTTAGVQVREYKWDFDTTSQFGTSDSDGDGDKTNDVDAALENPIFEYTEFGTYQVKLTVIDTHGNENSVTNMVTVSAAGGTGDTNTGVGDYDPGSFGLDPQGALNGTGLDDEVNGQGQANASGLKAAVVTSPLPDADGVVRLSGEGGTVVFDYSPSDGDIAYYIFDKNIYFDTDQDGTPNNEEDFKTSLPGLWTTNFEKAWGKTVVKLTVVDIYGNTNSTVQEIAFK
jgi:PKD repeat protein